MTPTAIIADDEAPLRSFLRRRLAECWPELAIVGEAGNGQEALDLVAAREPAIAFLDIAMPVLTGLEVAARLPRPAQVVFVTAYDQYAVDAFENAAVDYLLKPVGRERLARTVARLKATAPPAADFTALAARLLGQLAPRPEPRRWLPAATTEGIVMVPVDEVLYFQAADKYTRVVCADGEKLIRMSLKDLEGTLDPERFWRIHRNAIVQVAAIDRVAHDFRGNYLIHLRRHRHTLAVGPSYAGRFKPV